MVVQALCHVPPLACLECGMLLNIKHSAGDYCCELELLLDLLSQAALVFVLPSISSLPLLHASMMHESILFLGLLHAKNMLWFLCAWDILHIIFDCWNFSSQNLSLLWLLEPFSVYWWRSIVSLVLVINLSHVYLCTIYKFTMQIFFSCFTLNDAMILI